jgi:hypothetical protein
MIQDCHIVHVKFKTLTGARTCIPRGLIVTVNVSTEVNGRSGNQHVSACDPSRLDNRQSGQRRTATDSGQWERRLKDKTNVPQDSMDEPLRRFPIPRRCVIIAHFARHGY